GTPPRGRRRSPAGSRRGAPTAIRGRRPRPGGSGGCRSCGHSLSAVGTCRPRGGAGLPCGGQDGREGGHEGGVVVAGEVPLGGRDGGGRPVLLGECAGGTLGGP